METGAAARRLLMLVAAALAAWSTEANPVGGTVVQGAASISSQGSQLTVRQTTPRAQINWSSFNIEAGETTSFLQPSSSALVWNYIHDANPSQILGNLNANGYVVLQNSSGFYIGGQAVITTHGLLMTTAPIPVPDLSGGGAWDFGALPPTASIINYGQIRQASGDQGGSVFLIAADIQNKAGGSISAPGGQLGLYAGREVLVSSRPDGRGLSAKVTLPQGSVDNEGKLIADAGTIEMNAQVVNQGGLVQANSVRQANGLIELVASDSLTLGSSSTISVHGDDSSATASQGGVVVLNSSGTFADTTGSSMDISGRTGGHDGLVEIIGSGVTTASLQSQINGQSAANYQNAGGLLLAFDNSLATPADLALSSDPTSVSPNAPNVSISDLSAFSKIDLFAAGNIDLNSGWSLPASQDPYAVLRLSAGNSIVLADQTSISAPKNWNIDLTAGPQNLGARPIGAGRVDGIYLDGNSYIQSQDGSIQLWAANEVQINAGDSGSVGNNGIRTLAGGSVKVTTEYGDVNTGANPQGYKYNRTTAPYYTVSSTLGGISTKAGGDVTIDTGGDVTSFLPNSSQTGPNALADGGTGAFGPQPGNLTINAGGSVYGHYVVANGAGTITAQQNIGAASASENVALSLIDGSWTLNAPNGNIYLQEVRNPNGVFNGLGSTDTASYHLFNYSPLASITLNALNDAVLTGLNLPRPNDPVPVVFPPMLYINAGKVVLQTTLSLFPSPYQDLGIASTGDLIGAPIDPTAPTPELIMSDSPDSRWLGTTSFGDSDHRSSPLQVNNPNPAIVNVQGNMENLILIADKQTRIAVGGNMVDCGFAGENLHRGDVTSIDVAGNIQNRSLYSFVILDSAILAVPAADLPPGIASAWNTLLSLALDPAKIAAAQVPAGTDPSQLAAYAARVAPVGVSFDALTYDPATRRLGFLGQMDPQLLAKLGQPLTVLRYGSDGYPIVDASGHFVTDTVNWLDASAGDSQLAKLFNESQGASTEVGLGYRVGGPGEFDIHANSIALGNTYGILSCGVSDVQGGNFGYGSLASLPTASLNPPGATLNVTVEKDPDTATASLDMLTSTIASLGGGDLNITSLGGSINLGSQELLLGGVRQVAFGVFSSGHGNVNVTAHGNIDVAGSRIASYNGGSVTVISEDGNVNAGSGGTTFVQVPYSYIDANGVAGTYTEEVFGSGIVANTLVNGGSIPGSAPLPGNITVQTPHGSIYASLGGILQEALNGNLSAGPTVTLVAGSPGYVGNIDLGDSGVIGGTINATANGNITGLVISRQNSTINAAQSFSGIVLSGGTANLSAGGSISGTIVGVGGINASGGQGVSATLLSQNVSVAGAQAQSTLGTSASATTASQSAAQSANTEAQQQVAANGAEDDDDKKKNDKSPVLVRRVGRVTVILPPGS